MALTNIFSLTASFPLVERPWFIHVKVCVSSDAWTWKERVSQRPAFTIKERRVSMISRSKEQNNIRPFAAVFDVMVRNLLETERSHFLPDSEGLADSLVGLMLADAGWVVLNAGGKDC